MPITVLSVGYPLAPVAENTAGGAEQVLGILDEALVEQGYRSFVIAPEDSRCSGRLIPTKLPMARFDDAARSVAQEEYRKTIQAALTRCSVDVIHLHGIDFLEYLPEPGLPVVVTLHLPLSWYSPEAFSLSRPNTHLVCVSQSQRNSSRAASDCRVIPNGIRMDRYQPSRRKRDYALALGRICPEKGFHIALDAASEAGVPLILAGQVFGYQAHEEYFETMIRPRLTGRHQFVGAVGGQTKNDLLAEACCLLVPSLVEETSSLVAMEALACGTPVVAFPRGALKEIIEHDRTGLFVETQSQMAEAITRADQLSSSLCRERAEQRFSAGRMVGEYLSLYEEVVRAGDLLEPREVRR